MPRTARAKSARRTPRPGASRELLRQLPAIDALMNRPALQSLSSLSGRALALDAARAVLAELRTEVSHARHSPDAFSLFAIESRIIARAESWLSPSLRLVINATGVILHTNLGRAPLSRGAIDRIAATATQYSNLEYDVPRGARGKRDVHTSEKLARLLGAEAAILVNNNAAAVLLVLNTFAKGAEVIVSRGELIEIGDGFRIPDIMAESGALLREVGTTNRTRLADYERAITKATRLLLRVHPSNFRLTGFTGRPALEELVALSKRKHLPLFEDLGSGNLLDLAAHGVSEPVAAASLRAGVSLISASGDKLLGGPQAGLIAGKRALVDRVRRNPLFRALRLDKLAIAAMEATLSAYLRGALDEIPVLRMIRTPLEELDRRARAFAEHLRESLTPDLRASVHLEVISGNSVIGGGSTPDQPLPTRLVAIRSENYSATQLEQRLRSSTPPVIARIDRNRLLLDLRTVASDEEKYIAKGLLDAVRIE